MKLKSLAPYLIILSLLVIQILPAQGVHVIVCLLSKEEVKGELLSLRDSALVVAIAEISERNDSAKNRVAVRFLRIAEVQKVVVEGKSRILEGMGKGILYGGLTGAAIGLISGDDPPGGFLRFTAPEKALMLGLVFGTGGFVIGTIAGAASSSSGQDLQPLPGGDFSIVRPLTRYASGEPAWLRSMQ